MSNSKRAQLEIKIARYRRLARDNATNAQTVKSIEDLIGELERQLRKMDEEQ